MTETVVRVTGVAVRHEDFPLLLPTTFEVARGGCASVRGANGAGKSTLLKVLAGRIAATEGEAAVRGAPVDDRSPRFRRAVSASLGVPAYYDDLTLIDHLQLVERIWGDRTDRSVFDDLGLSHLANRMPHELSSGQQQLFHLALALARPAEVLLLDEPEQRLDQDHRANLGAILVRRRGAGTAIVLATHDAALAGAVGTVDVALRVPGEPRP